MSQPRFPRLAAIASAALLVLAASAHATEERAITNARPASAASGPTAHRTMKFTTHHRVPATLTLRGKDPITNTWTAQFRFDGQTEAHTCALHLPKLGQVVQPGETVIGNIQCTTPWQLYDNGMGFEAFQGDAKVAEGTLRP